MRTSRAAAIAGLAGIAVSATPTSTATDPDRVFTTGKLLHGRMLSVDSHFDEQTAQGSYEVVTARMPR